MIKIYLFINFFFFFIFIFSLAHYLFLCFYIYKEKELYYNLEKFNKFTLRNNIKWNLISLNSPFLILILLLINLLVFTLKIHRFNEQII